MAKKKKIPDKLQIWIEVRKRYHLSDAHIQMARELGLNPKKFEKLANTKQEPWKAPLPDFIERIYYKHFGKRRPDNVKSIEQLVKDRRVKQEERRKRKQERRQAEAATEAIEKRPMVGVGVIVTKSEHVLLLKRKSVHGAGTWCPPGGHLEYGESPEECAIREVREETNVCIKEAKFTGITNDIFEEYEKHYITLWFEGQYVSGEPEVNAPYEMSEAGWFAWENLPQPLFLPFQNLLQGKSYSIRHNSGKELQRIKNTTD